MLATTTDYSTRIHAGKQVEHKIIAQLRAKGMTIHDPTPEQDKYDKIDGIGVSPSGKNFSIQIKFRETGDDILFELVSDLDKKKPGRDIISKADLYIVADRNGTTRMFYTAPIKEKAKEILAAAEKDLTENPYKTRWEGNGWEAKMQWDHASGARKIVAYFDPRSFQELGHWKLTLH